MNLMILAYLLQAAQCVATVGIFIVLIALTIVIARKKL